MSQQKIDQLSLLRADLRNTASEKKAKLLARFFKTGPGQYGEGDVFIGVMVPETRRAAKAHADISLKEAEELLHSKIHEERLCAILILINKYQKGDQKIKEQIYKTYLKNTDYINNWDLVDLSAHHLVGDFLADKPKDILYKLAKSKSLWERRIAVISTFNYIGQGKHEEAMQMAKILLHDRHDLIHKAVGWMLREVGKRCSEKILEEFLDKNYMSMPRTMLRYAIERLPEEKRQSYLKGNA